MPKHPTRGSFFLKASTISALTLGLTATAFAVPTTLQSSEESASGQQVFTLAESAAATTINSTVLETQVNLGEGILVHIPVTIDQTKSEEILNQIRELRGQLWDDPEFMYQPWFNSKGPKTLKQYLQEDAGIQTKEEYQNMVQWDSSAEYMAIQRAAENIIYWDHDRPNGTSSSEYSAWRGSPEVYLENLAANSSDAVYAWAFGTSGGMSEYEALIKAQGDPWGGYIDENGRYHQVGHIHALVNPDYSTTGFAQIGVNSVWIGRPSSATADNTYTNIAGSYAIKATIAPEALNQFTLQSPETLALDETAEALVLNPENPNFLPWSDQLDYSRIEVQGYYSSSNPDVATIDSESGVIQPVAAGTTEISFIPYYLNADGSRTEGTPLVRSLTITAPATPTAEPTAEPTVEPTVEPTQEPTAEPSASASPEPTAAPTAEPTVEPTVEPTQEPTAEPSASASPEPTVEPTTEPTAEPTAEPTVEPTQEPTAEPTQEPTVEPTAEPSASASPEPTAAPTTEPTAEPTVEPTVDPSASASPTATAEPSPTASAVPTAEPSATETATPTASAAPTAEAIGDAPAPTATPFVYENCAAVYAANAAPIYEGQYGWHPSLDADGDKKGCEVTPNYTNPAKAPETSTAKTQATGGALAKTGSNLTGYLATGALFLSLGAVALLVIRRKKAS